MVRKEESGIETQSPIFTVLPPLSLSSLTLTQAKNMLFSANADSDGDGKAKLITSVSNPFVKHCVKLRNSSSLAALMVLLFLLVLLPSGYAFLFEKREIYRFQESFQDENIRMDCLILPDKAEIPNGLGKSTDSLVLASSTVMRKLSGLQWTDSVDAIAVMKIPASFFIVDDDRKKADCKKWFPSAHRILVLDGTQEILYVPFRFLRTDVFVLFTAGSWQPWYISQISCGL